MQAMPLVAFLLFTASAALGPKCRRRTPPASGEVGFFPAATIQWKAGPASLRKQVEHVTVISGLLHLGIGERFDRSATRPMPAGSFGYWPIGMRHFAWAEGETVLQLHGRGPWTVTYVNPADDPRNQGR